MEHVYQGLKCLKYFPTEDSSEENQKEEEEKRREKEKQEYEETHPTMAKPFQAIPMPYTSLKESKKETESGEGSVSNSPSHKKKLKQKKNKKSGKTVLKEESSEIEPKALLCKYKAKTLPTWQAPKKSDNISWNAHLKTLLYEKASLIFAVLAENEYANKNYGASLRYMLAVLRCQNILEVFCGIRNDKSVSYLLGRAGDCCFMAVQDWCNVEKHRKDYETKNPTEEKIVEEICKVEDLDMSTSLNKIYIVQSYYNAENNLFFILDGAELLPQRLETLEATLVASYQCYEKALSLEPLDMDRNNLLRRLGNIHNELGVLYMNQAGSKSFFYEFCYQEILCIDLTSKLLFFQRGINKTVLQKTRPDFHYP